jgi:hypothetical protein
MESKFSTEGSTSGMMNRHGYSGYVVGERASIKRPQELFFDNIAIFCGYAGDFNTPNVIRRADHLSQSNFHRSIFEKRHR